MKVKKGKENLTEMGSDGSDISNCGSKDEEVTKEKDFSRKSESSEKSFETANKDFKSAIKGNNSKIESTPKGILNKDSNLKKVHSETNLRKSSNFVDSDLDSLVSLSNDELCEKPYDSDSAIKKSRNQNGSKIYSKLLKAEKA